MLGIDNNFSRKKYKIFPVLRDKGKRSNFTLRRLCEDITKVNYGK
jgi:hypothetical protein